MRKTQVHNLSSGGRVWLEPEFIDPVRADAWFERLRRALDWQQREITLFGRHVVQPRLVAWYGDTGVRYRYSGQTLTAHGWPPVLSDIRRLVQQRLDTHFNSVLCNLYRDGADSMGWHADNEPELGDAPVIASISLGAERRFVLRRRDERARKLELSLPHGSLLVMEGDVQKHWQHALPKTQKPIGARINLTFRRIL